MPPLKSLLTGSISASFWLVVILPPMTTWPARW